MPFDRPKRGIDRRVDSDEGPPRTTASRWRVMIANDRAWRRAVIRRAVASDPRFAVCAEVADAPSAVVAAARERPAVCLLEVGMPGGGISAAWEISARLPQTRVVMFSNSRDPAHLLAALRAGAMGYLRSDMNLARLPAVLNDVVMGKPAIPRDLVSYLVDEIRDRRARHRVLLDSGEAPHLTSREWQVLDLLRLELSTAQIARRLVLSEATVRSHIASTMAKLGVPDRTALITRFRGGE
jgi:DNA-binding NarL/FixJ family response regulator